MAFRKTQLSVERVSSLLASGHSINSAANILNVKWDTLTHFCRLHDIAYTTRLPPAPKPKGPPPSPAMIRLAQYCALTRRALAERRGEPFDPPMGQTYFGSEAKQHKSKGDY